jgi:hypothetical protein
MAYRFVAGLRTSEPGGQNSAWNERPLRGKVIPAQGGAVMKALSLLVIAALAVTVIVGGMNVAKAQEIVCSAMQGQLVEPSGTPVSGVEVRRDWSWRGKTGRDTTRTGADGSFAFPEVPAKRGLFGFLPAEEVVVQRYYAELPAGPFEFLFVSRPNLKPGAETGGRPFNVRCKVGVEPGFDGFAWGTCELR